MDGINCDSGSDNMVPPENKDPNEVINYLQSKKFVELKTSRHITNRHQDKTFKYVNFNIFLDSFQYGLFMFSCLFI